MTYAKNREDFVRAMVAEFGDTIATRAAIRVFLREAMVHAGLSVAQCNGPQTPQDRAMPWDDWEARRALKESECEARILKAAGAISARVKFGGDPRGFTVKVMMPRTGAYNSWGGASEGFGVPTRDI